MRVALSMRRLVEAVVEGQAVGATNVAYARDATDRITSRSEAGITTRYGYSNDGDTPDFTMDANGTVVERSFALLGGATLTKRAAGGDVWSYPNVHGDVMATADAAGAKVGATLTYDPDGQALSGLPDNSAGNMDYAWLGRHQRPLELAMGPPWSVELDQLGLERAFERLGDGAVGAVADRADRCRDASVGEAVALADRGVLAASVAVMNHVAAGQITPPDRHLQGVEDEVGAEVVGDLPADDGSAVDVEDEGDVHPSLPGRGVGDVGQPQLVGPGRHEAAIDQIRRAKRAVVGRGGEAPSRNQRVPTADDKPAAAAASSLDNPPAVASQNRCRSSRRQPRRTTG